MFKAFWLFRPLQHVQEGFVSKDTDFFRNESDLPSGDNVWKNRVSTIFSIGQFLIRYVHCIFETVGVHQWSFVSTFDFENERFVFLTFGVLWLLEL